MLGVFPVRMICSLPVSLGISRYQPFAAFHVEPFFFAGETYSDEVISGALNQPDAVKVAPTAKPASKSGADVEADDRRHRSPKGPSTAVRSPAVVASSAWPVASATAVVPAASASKCHTPT